MRHLYKSPQIAEMRKDGIQKPIVMPIEEGFGELLNVFYNQLIWCWCSLSTKPI